MLRSINVQIDVLRCKIFAISLAKIQPLEKRSKVLSDLLLLKAFIKKFHSNSFRKLGLLAKRLMKTPVKSRSTRVLKYSANNAS